MRFFLENHAKGLINKCTYIYLYKWCVTERRDAMRRRAKNDRADTRNLLVPVTPSSRTICARLAPCVYESPLTSALAAIMLPVRGQSALSPLLPNYHRIGETAERKVRFFPGYKRILKVTFTTSRLDSLKERVWVSHTPVRTSRHEQGTASPAAVKVMNKPRRIQRAQRREKLVSVQVGNSKSGRIKKSTGIGSRVAGGLARHVFLRTSLALRVRVSRTQR